MSCLFLPLFIFATAVAAWALYETQREPGRFGSRLPTLFGAAFVGLIGCVLCGPIDLAIHAAFGALGAYIYGRYRGPAPDPSYF